jgi:hypothetical protein
MENKDSSGKWEREQKPQRISKGRSNLGRCEHHTLQLSPHKLNPLVCFFITDWILHAPTHSYTMKISDPSSESSGGAKFLIAFFSGGMAGLVAKTLVAPLDRMKIIFQVTNEKFTFSNMPKIFSHVVEKEGFLSLWKGNSAMILRIAPYAALQFMTYEQMKAWFVR